MGHQNIDVGFNHLLSSSDLNEKSNLKWESIDDNNNLVIPEYCIPVALENQVMRLNMEELIQEFMISKYNQIICLKSYNQFIISNLIMLLMENITV